MTTSRWREGFTGKFFVFAPEAVERFFHMPLSRVEFEARDVVQSAAERPVIAHLMSAVTAEIEAGNPGGPLVIESLSAAALRSIVRLPERSHVVRGLTSRQAKVIRELIIERSGERLSLVDMANAAGLSTGHMLRAFKITFGVTPHQYLIRQRLDCSMELLRTTTLGLDEIALIAGFGARAQMTRTFRTVLGTTPKAFR